MAIAFVTGQKAAAGNSAAGTTLAVSFPATTTAGNLLVVHCGGLATVSSVGDDGGNTWTKAIADPGNTTGSSEIWYKHNAAAALTVTVTYSSSNGFRYASVSEFSGVMTSADPLDKTDSDVHAGTAATSITTPDVTPAVDGELIFVGGRDTGAGTDTPNSPFTLLSQSGQADCDGYNIQTTATATHGDINNTGDTDWVVQIATFKPPTVNADRDVLIRFGSMNLADGSGLITAAFVTDAGAAAVFGGALLDYYSHIVQELN